MPGLATHEYVRMAVAAVCRQPLVAAGASAWCAAVMATTIAAPDLPGGVSRAVGSGGGARAGQPAVAGAQARGVASTRVGRAGGAPDTGGVAPGGVSPDTAQVQGITVDGTGSSLTVDGGFDGIAPQMVVTGARPGTVGAMQLRVRNDGGHDVDLELSRGVVDDLPGLGGGMLSRRLELVILDAESGSAHWRGALGEFAEAELGSLAAGAERRWRLELRFPDGGVDGGDNAYQGAGVAATYVLRET
jgi:hypothetical protein